MKTRLAASMSAERARRTARPAWTLVILAFNLCLICPAAVPAASPFAIRGLLPWHNFLSGPTAWNESDYLRYLDRMKRLGLNYIAFHCYTGGEERYATYVEPLIRIEYRGVVPEARYDTSLTARWGYRPLPVSKFAFGTASLFNLPPAAKAFGADCAVLARDNEDRYDRAQALMRHVIAAAHRRGIQVGIGFEFGIHPPEFASIVPQDSILHGAMLPDPTHPASIEILHAELDDVLRAYPNVDWIWLWLHEHTMYVGQPRFSDRFREYLENNRKFFENANAQTRFTGVWSLAYIREACRYLHKRAPNIRIAISGWGGGNQLPEVLRGLDRALPPNIVFSCLNPNQGLAPQPPVLAQIAKHREVWAIPWLEGDSRLWLLQPRVTALRKQIRLAAQQKIQGVLAIHWRTEETRANLKAFARFAADPVHAPTVKSFYGDDCASRFGRAAARVVAPMLVDYDRHQLINAETPEYFPYDPGWGRLKPSRRARIAKDAATVARLAKQTPNKQHRANLDWLAANLQFTVLLDEVGRAMAPAYRLKDRWIRGDPPEAQAFAGARQALEGAPIKELFETFARRVRSRGELGELSSLNQRLWLQYRELQDFLESAKTKRPGLH